MPCENMTDPTPAGDTTGKEVSERPHPPPAAADAAAAAHAALATAAVTSIAAADPAGNKKQRLEPAGAAKSAASPGPAEAPLSLAAAEAEPHKKKKAKASSRVTAAAADGTSEHADGSGNHNNDLPSSSHAEAKKSKKKSAKNKSPIEGGETAASSVNPEENASSTSNDIENTGGGQGGVHRVRGFTAVNSVLPVASAKPPQVDPAMEQLLLESAAAVAAAEKDVDGDVPMDRPSTPPAKKHKRKRKDKAANTEDGAEQEATAPQSAKKRKGKDRAVEVSPDTQVPATQDVEQTPPTTAEAAPEGSGTTGEGDAAAPKKKHKKKTKDTPPVEAIETTEQTPAPVNDQEAANGYGEIESVPATQPEPDVLRQATPPLRPVSPPLPTLTAADVTSDITVESTPTLAHTPKPKSKVAIAYERKRKRLEAAAAASSSPAQAQMHTEVGDSMDLDVPNEDDEDTTTAAAAFARDTPKSNKRKKRRMPDLNTPSRPAVADEHTSPRSDDEGDDVVGEGGVDAADGSLAGPSRTPRPKSTPKKPKAPKTPKTPKPVSTIVATPQPGTTALNRKRASYTYAPNPTPATPPSTGTFTQPECATIDNYLQVFTLQNQLTQTQLIARIWGDTSVVPTQTKAEREAFWKDLYELFPHRKRLAIYNHVRRRYHNFDVQGAKWDEEQDAELAKMVEQMGKKWTNIGRTMGRLPDDCRDRWRNYVKCGQGRREKEWTDEEEAKLRQVVQEMKEALRVAAEERGEALEQYVEPNWTVVSEKMGGWRSRIQCRYKWSKMLEWEGRPRLPDVEGAGEDGVEGARKIKTPKRRAPRKSIAADGAAEQPHDEVPIDPALADAGIPADGAPATPAAKKPRAKKAATTKTPKSKAAAGGADEPPASADAADGNGSDTTTTTPLASSQMLTGDRIWLLESILTYNPEVPGDIKWDELAARCAHKGWTARGLERAFGRIVKKGIARREREGLGVVEGVQRLLGELAELPEGVRGERWVSPEAEADVEGGEEGEGEAGEGSEDAAGRAKGKGKGKGKAKGKGAKRGRKPKGAGAAAGEGEAEGTGNGNVEGEGEAQGEGEGEGQLRDAVRMAMESVKEREETEKLARVLLSSVQEAYGTQ